MTKTIGALLRATAAAAVLSAAGFGATAPALAKDPMVGGAAIYATKNIVENAVHSKDHTTLVAAVKAAGLVDTLEGPGPFTVFAPTNEAFAMLPAGAVDNLLKPENKKSLTEVLTYHVVPGKLSAKKIMADAAKMGGTAEYKTVEGGTLRFRMKGKSLMVMDDSGGAAKVTIANVNQSNGVIHVINHVLMPKM